MKIRTLWSHIFKDNYLFSIDWTNGKHYRCLSFCLTSFNWFQVISFSLHHPLRTIWRIGFSANRRADNITTTYLLSIATFNVILSLQGRNSHENESPPSSTHTHHDH